MDIDGFVEWKNGMDKLYIEIDKRLTNSSLVGLQEEWVIRAQPKGSKNYNSEKTLNTFDHYLYTPFGLLYLIYLLTN